MTKTTDNLKTAFAGESQANRKYLAFAKKADQEGYPQVARLFRAAAAAETVHAHSELRLLDGIRSTSENLTEAAGGENYEASKMYPEFIQDAEAEGNQKAVSIFRYAMEAEKVHEALYREALATLAETGEEFDYYICPVCGFVAKKGAPEKCPICNTAGTRFERIQ